MVPPVHTSHACRFCRQKRSKCDGKRPCERCQRWNQTCEYDDRKLETKGDLRRERDELQDRHRHASTVFEALQSESLVDETIASLWSRTPLDQIASSLASSTSNRIASSPIADTLADGPSSPKSKDATHRQGVTSPSQSNPTLVSRSSEFQHSSTFTPIRPNRDDFYTLSPRGERAIPGGPSKTIDPSEAPWRLMGLDSRQVEELLDIFFDWQYIPLFFIDRKDLERDFSEGKHEHCSPALIRAILSLACRSLGGYDADYSFHVNLGGRLHDEAIELLEDSKSASHGLPDALALGFLAIHQLGSRDNKDALRLAEQCVSMLISLHQKDSQIHLDASEISWASKLSTCLHGAVSLLRIIRLAFQCLNRPIDLEDTAPSSWLLPSRRTDHGLLQVLRTPTISDPSNDLDRFSAVLVTLTSSVSRFISTIKEPVTAYSAELLNVYYDCLSQYSGLNAALQSLDISRTSMLYTHLVYHFSLLSLCRPFCHIPASGAPVDFRAICMETVQAILSLSTTYQDLVLSRQLPVFVPLFVYAAGIVSFELTTNAPPQFRPQPQLVRQESSRETDNTESSGSMSAPVSTPPSSIMSPPDLSPSQSFKTTPIPHRGKRKLDHISDSPAPPPVPMVEAPGVVKAMSCLETMKSVFPLAREGYEHLGRLLPGQSSPVARARDIGYEFS